MRLRLILLAALIAVVAPPLRADDVPDLATHLVTLLGYEEDYARFRDACVAARASIAPESLVSVHPEYFGGITPGTPKWPAVSKAYRDYVIDSCSRPTREEFLGALAEYYSHVLTEPQLRVAIAFYATPTGKALVAAREPSAEAVRDAWTGANSLHLAEATATLERRIAVLLESQ
ncbi:MAG: DUF2059 domain-containing protein [Burkholderiales bacterium]